MGLGFVYGEGIAPETQAGVFARRARQLDCAAWSSMPRIWASGAGRCQRPDRARQYMSALRGALAGVEGITLALSSYRFPQSHPFFPFAAFMADCEIAMPQVYWVARSEGDAIGNLRRCYEQYKELFPDRLIIPVGAAYGEVYGSASDRYFWSSSPRQIHRFMDQARAMGLPAVTFWSWEHAYYDQGNRQYNGRELWDAVASYQYDDIQLVGGGPVQDGRSYGQEEHTNPEDEIQIGVGQEGYRDGVYPQFPYAVFIPQIANGRQLKYARTVSNTPSSVWAWGPIFWSPANTRSASGCRGQHATSRTAQYQIHGVVGENERLSST